ncbi:MAG: hypothetical protein ACK6D3_15585 [Planctomycetaceae bacterium]
MPASPPLSLRSEVSGGGHRWGPAAWFALPLAAWLAGCASPFEFAPADAVVLPRDRLQALAQQDGPGSLYYCGTEEGYHYLVDPRPGVRRVYKAKAKDLKLEDTFRRGEDEPYLVHPHLLEGRRLGQRPRELPGVEFEVPSSDSAAGPRD